MKQFLFILLLAAPAYAATPAYVGSSFTCINGTSPLTFSSVVVSAGQTLVVGVTIATGGATQISSIQWNSAQNFTNFNEIFNGSTDRGELWGLLAPTATTANVVVTDNGGGASMQACLVKFTNVASFGTSVEASNTVGSATVTCSSAAGQLVIDVTAQRGGEAIGTAGAGQTSMGTSTTGDIFTGMSYEDGAASVVMSWSNTLNQFADICVPLVGAADNVNSLLLMGVGK